MIVASLPDFTAAAAAAKSLQSCPTLCDPINGSPPGSSVPGILQARILEWVVISFSNACMHAKSLQSCPTLCDSIDGSPPGSPISGILQARTLEWVAISFSTVSDYTPLNPLLLLPLPRKTTRGRPRPAFGPAPVQVAPGRLRGRTCFPGATSDYASLWLSTDL